MTRDKKRCRHGAASSDRRRRVTSATCPLARKPAPRHGTTAAYESVAGAVLRSARRSAHISQARLATACGVTENIIRTWENGSSPLAAVPMPQIVVLIDALLEAGACRPLTVDLTVAIWCDLIITAVAASEDVTCMLADSIAAEDVFDELMAWCLEGRIPQRHLPYAGPGPLVSEQALIERIRHALN
jgi:transcriptional regulator with XRE-family HTH domain